MNRTFGTFKGTLMLVLLMLIASRLTWLQTSETTVDLSSTFYRTGLWFNDHYAKNCKEPPEATFPLPHIFTIRSDGQPPPPPALGELSPGLAIVMAAKCSWERLETEDLAHWNAWLYLVATLFSAIAVRLFTNSWTAGLLAAVAVLSRGTLQNRTLYATSEPYASAFFAASWCFLLSYLRSLWRPWLLGTLGCLTLATLFVPSLWASLLLLSICPALAIPFVFFRRRSGPLENNEYISSKNEDQIAPGPFDKAIFEDLIGVYSIRQYAIATLIGLTVTGICAFFIQHFMPGALPQAQIVAELLSSLSAWKALAGSVSSAIEIADIYRPDVDWHAWLTVVLIAVQPLTGGRFAKINRIAALLFALVCGAQIICSIFHESYFIHTTMQAHPSIVPAARSIEPIFIAWGTGCAWRILDVFTGYRLSYSGWSIRGRDRITNS